MQYFRAHCYGRLPTETQWGWQRLRLQNKKSCRKFTLSAGFGSVVIALSLKGGAIKSLWKGVWGCLPFRGEVARSARGLLHDAAIDRTKACIDARCKAVIADSDRHNLSSERFSPSLERRARPFSSVSDLLRQVHAARYPYGNAHSRSLSRRLRSKPYRELL